MDVATPEGVAVVFVDVCVVMPCVTTQCMAVP